jgi:hypothetical protein
MKSFLKVLTAIFILFLSDKLYSQTAIQKSAENYTCNCITNLIQTDSINIKESSVADCFYKGVSKAIEEKYTVDGKLKMTGKRFIIVSGDLLHYLQVQLLISCPAYKKYLQTSNKAPLRFK